MLTVDGRKGRPFWLHISTQKKTDGHQRPYRLPFPIYKIVSYAPRGVKERTRRWTDNKSHGILLSISSRRCRFLSFHIPFFSILNISHLSRSPGQRLYVIFWSFFFDFFFSLSHLMELWLSLSWCAGLGVLLQPWLSAANKQEQQTSWFVSVRPVWTGQPSVGCNHPPWEQQPPAAYINFVRFHFILFHSELPNRQNSLGGGGGLCVDEW